MLKVKDHDDVDVCLIKMIIPYAGILKYPKYIFNNSLQNGDFPDNMKLVRVIPILRKDDVHGILSTVQCLFYFSSRKY